MSGFIDNFNALIDPLLMLTLGDDVVFIPSTGGSFAIKAAFEAEYYQINAGSGVESASPALICNEVDIPNYNHGGRIVVNDCSYRIVNAQPDGAGQVVLILQQA